MTPEEEKLLFYAAIGESITEWTHVEDHLYMVLQRCLQPADHELVAAAFYAVDAFKTKLAIVDAVATRFFAGSGHLADWGKLKLAIEKRIRKRNELAHYQVEYNPASPEGRRYKLIPPLLDPHTPSKGLEITGLNLNELKCRVRVFEVLSRRIRDFTIAALPLVQIE
jgi:hypothetical protein